MATILVTGGAGYVGAHCCLALKRAGHEPVVYDNLSNGYPAFVRWGPLEQGDVRDKPRLREVFTKHKPEAVIHCAASIEVGESVKHPDRFYENNVVGALTLFDVMHETGVKVFVFSSTCAIYGEPISLPMDETHRQQPVSPYGWTKLMVERMSRDCSAAYGAKFAHLRYFNAAGAAPEERIGERHEPETHAIPLALFTLLGRRDSFKVFGADYGTRDGSCLRDYVHVLDLADAHVRAVDRLLGGGESIAANLGGMGIRPRCLRTIRWRVESLAGRPSATSTKSSPTLGDGTPVQSRRCSAERRGARRYGRPTLT
jgi:UDP-glucose 4-epimerase